MSRRKKGGGRFFGQTTRKGTSRVFNFERISPLTHKTQTGEMATIQKELRSLKPEVQKNAIKRVVAGMTIGTDMSILFADVVNLMQSNDLELKKMVYLYTMKYAKANPDLAILAINTFKKDTRDPNPLIRALAVRTMGCLHLEKIAEYLCDPLQRCLKDEDPYVKKTAAVCVAKLYVSLRLSFITLTH